MLFCSIIKGFTLLRYVFHASLQHPQTIDTGAHDDPTLRRLWLESDLLFHSLGTSTCGTFDSSFLV
eukprot:755796-Hanusia_phi.AAC.8